MIQFSMDDPDYHKPGYFDPPFKLQSYLNLIFSIIHFVYGFISFVFIVPLFIIGIILLPIWIGVPLLNLTFYLSSRLTTLNQHINELLYRRNIVIVKIPASQKSSQLSIFYDHTKNKRSWRYLLYNFIGLFINTVGVSLTAALLFMTYLLISTPYNAMFGHIDFLGYQTDYFFEAIILFFIGLIIWFGFFNITNYWTNTHIKILRYFISR